MILWRCYIIIYEVWNKKIFLQESPKMKITFLCLLHIMTHKNYWYIEIENIWNVISRQTKISYANTASRHEFWYKYCRNKITF